MTNLFDFSDPNALLLKATKASAIRRSGTVAETVRHSLIHTPSPNASLHHTIMAACPHPQRTRANDGEHYMVAYVSIPLEWLPLITGDFAVQHNVSFIGPAGTVQRLPPSMTDMEDAIGPRVYIGFDWLSYCQHTPPTQQPHYDKIKPELIAFVTRVREVYEEQHVDTLVDG